MKSNHIYTVTDLTAAVAHTVESTFPYVWIQGQVSNLSRPSSGHIYFSLRDETASLTAVWFKGNQREQETFDPLTGEVYENGSRQCLAATLENGQEVVCAGRLTVYAARGVYQLVVELVQAVGQGNLHKEFERLKEKLAKQGYFALERKRPLPQNPTRVVVITAPTGAAIHDFLQIASQRGVGATIRISPAQMQGKGAAQGIVAAIHRIQQEKWAQVIVIIRGGGSLEDLWEFNNEDLATAIKNSELPVLAGIGHEVDVTLSDMTADCRAATPTHAAQLLWTDRQELVAALERLRNDLDDTLSGYLSRQFEQVSYASRQVSSHSPARHFSSWKERIAAAVARFDMASYRYVQLQTQKIAMAETAIVRFPLTLQQQVLVLENMQHKLSMQQEHFLSSVSFTLERTQLRLDAANPLQPLERGYALIYNKKDSLVRTTDMVVQGEELHVHVHDGSIHVRVEHAKKDTL